MKGSITISIAIAMVAGIGIPLMGYFLALTNKNENKIESVEAELRYKG